MEHLQQQRLEHSQIKIQMLRRAHCLEVFNLGRKCALPVFPVFSLTLSIRASCLRWHLLPHPRAPASPTRKAARR